MGVLAAVLADAGHVALDVAGLQVRRVEGRVEQLDEPRVAVDQVLVHRRHGLAGAHGVSGPRYDRPALADRVDPAFVVGRTNPGACRRRSRPAGTSRRPRRGPRCWPAAPPPGPRTTAAKLVVSAAPRPDRRTGAGSRRGTRPATRSRPCPRWPTRFMPSFQSPVPISGNPCAAETQAVLDGAHAVLVESRRFGRTLRLIVVGLFLRIQFPALEEGAPARRARRCRPSPARTGRSRTAARDSRRRNASARPARRADATSAARRPRGTGARRSAADARGRATGSRGSGPCVSCN